MTLLLLPAPPVLPLPLPAPGAILPHQWRYQEWVDRNPDIEPDFEERCGECGGLGWVECSTCDGEGAEANFFDAEHDYTCETCHGYGIVDCDKCEGTGVIVTGLEAEYKRQCELDILHWQQWHGIP